MEDQSMRLLLLLCLIPINWLCGRWLWAYVCRSAGVTRHEVRVRNWGISSVEARGKYMLHWLCQRSPHPRRTAAAIAAYQFGSAFPLAIAIGLNLFSLFTPFLEAAARWATIIAPCIIALVGISGLIYTKLLKKPDADYDRREAADGSKKLIPFADLLGPEHQGKKPTAKGVAKGIIKLAVVLGLFALILWGILEMTSKPQPEATPEQVGQVLAAEGYTPEDTTGSWKDPEAALEKVLHAETGTFSFDFFDLKTDKAAYALWKQIYGLVKEQMDTGDAVDSSSTYANVNLYSITQNGTYVAVIRVGSTVVYTGSTEGGREAVSQVLEAIGYPK